MQKLLRLGQARKQLQPDDLSGPIRLVGENPARPMRILPMILLLAVMTAAAPTASSRKALPVDYEEDWPFWLEDRVFYV